MWTLVLTLVLLDGGSMAITSVAGFDGRERCLTAGQTWIDNNKTPIYGWIKSYRHKALRLSALCMQTHEASK